MNKYCTYLYKRSKKYKIVFYCKYYKRYISYSIDCKSCLNRNVVTNKPIKKVSNHKKVVSKETYIKVYERDNGRCRLCGNSNNIQLHHIYFRSERIDLIDEPTNCIMLCNDCHRLVHSNKHKWQPILLNMIKEE